MSVRLVDHSRNQWEVRGFTSEQHFDLLGKNKNLQDKVTVWWDHEAGSKVSSEMALAVLGVGQSHRMLLNDRSEVSLKAI